MASAVIFGSFALFLFCTVPIGIAIGMSVITYLLAFGTQPLSYVASNMFTSCDSFPLMAIPFFVLAGSLMEGGGLSKRLVNFAESLVGHFTGGFAIVTIVTCMFFGAISGSAPATVAAIGVVMIPAMIEKGYSREFSVALIAASGCLGVIVPPSIPMVMYGVATGASVGKLFMGGFGPALVVGGILIVLSLYICNKRGFKGSGNKFSIKKVIIEFKNAVWALFVPIIILGGIYGGIFTPTESAVVAVIYGLIAGIFIYRELTLKKIVDCLINSSITVGTVLIIVGTGTTLGKILTIERVPEMIANWMLGISDSPIIILLVINLFLLVVGCVMDTTAAMLILAPILFPIAAACGVDLIHFGLIMVVNLAIGFVTPPVGVNLFVASGIGNLEFGKLSKAIVPFIIALFIAQLIITYVPSLTTWLPSVLLK